MKQSFWIAISTFLLIIFTHLCFPLEIIGQDKKQVEAIRISEPPKIDGELSDEAWKGVPEASGFVQQFPHNGDPASFDTWVKFVYNDKALYIGAYMYDPNPDSILTELGKRDELNMVDIFGVYIDCFNDYLNAYGFIVTATGVQVDLRSSIDDNASDYNPGDKSWDAVWDSQVKIGKEGWQVEMKIPYSALRFPKTEDQLWSVQIYRNIKRYREMSSWNLIEPELEGINHQSGELLGIKDIDPPFRLSLVPYVSGYLEKIPESSGWGYYGNYGLDLKYGINESYTLDMTLIPDFGQVQSDDEIYNLTPFEVYYDERRPFFMEGTELFRKGNVFYSRRIGSEPYDHDLVEDQLNENEKIISNPSESDLINATKISGKGNKNLGVGLFNAMTSNMYAEVKDTLTGKTRNILTGPFTNYNMLVFDQALKNNSFLSFYNTNVYTPKNDYMANVTGGEFRLTNKSNKYGIWAKGIASQKYLKGISPDFGYLLTLKAGKISGNFTYNIEHVQVDNRYDPNDMGFLRHNNYISDEISFNYNIYKPFWKLLNWYNSLDFNLDFLYRPNTFTNFGLDFSSHGTFRNHLTTWFNASISPVNSYDYYEPRQEGRYFITPPSYNVGLGISPDYRKKFIVDINTGAWWSPEYQQKTYWIYLEPRLRLSDHIMLIGSIQYIKNLNELGYVNTLSNNYNESYIVFGRRETDTYENVLEADFRFNSKSSIGFRARHYFIPVRYDQYYLLQNDGTISIYEYPEIHDENYNVFNIDMVYVWNFAPGSEISIVWKNFIETQDKLDEINSILNKNYFTNFDYTLESEAINSFSVKVLYYLDYEYLKKGK